MSIGLLPGAILTTATTAVGAVGTAFIKGSKDAAKEGKAAGAEGDGATATVLEEGGAGTLGGFEGLVAGGIGGAVAGMAICGAIDLFNHKK